MVKQYNIYKWNYFLIVFSPDYTTDYTNTKTIYTTCSHTKKMQLVHLASTVL